MEKYQSYGFNEFLSDPDFREWVRQGQAASHPVWPRVVTVYPEKAEELQLAAEVLSDLFDKELDVTPTVLEAEVARILKSTSPQNPKIRVLGTW